jgi:hypothetical protein
VKAIRFVYIRSIPATLKNWSQSSLIAIPVTADGGDSSSQRSGHDLNDIRGFE